MTESSSLNVLITGGAGFLGRACAQEYKQRGHRVTGIGHATWTSDAATATGYASWHTANVDSASLSELKGEFDVVVHCAANGSVPYSLAHPLEAFKRTVQTTAEVLEFCRKRPNPPLVVYPSSAAVYGTAPDRPLTESAPSNPVSPYGYHKRMAEDLLASYARHHGVHSAVIRFFSIYGPGLDKQLLWDAATKLCSGSEMVTFWGTGEETRDWIHVRDAARLVVKAGRMTESFSVINGGSGKRVTVKETLCLLRDHLMSNSKITFNGLMRTGDPRFYHANMTQAEQMNWSPTVKLADGLKEYAEWFRSIQ